MSRKNLIVMSVIDCVFGLVYLSTHGTVSGLALAGNFFLAVLLCIYVTVDLRARGRRYPVVYGITYLLAPLIGLLVYVAASAPPRGAPASPAT